MEKKIFVLDASAIIGSHNFHDSDNFTINEVISEIKDFKSKLFLQSALEERRIKLDEPDEEDLRKVESITKSSGDILRLSEVDRKVIALALKFRRKGLSPVVLTDDYTMQNTLKIIKIPFKSILTPGIEEILNWIKICKGCKKKYPSDYKFDECEICGSRIIKRKIKKNNSL